MRLWSIVIAAACLAACSPDGANDGQDVGADEAGPVRLYFNAAYDPAADPFADLEAAKAEAAASGRRILVEVGGDWCSWCHILDAYLEDDPDVRGAFADSFLMLRVNWSDENENPDFLGRYPDIPGYPHFFVLDADGGLLASQGTAVLEDGGQSYDRAAMLAFADAWDAGAR